jgi:predicted DNA-binding transcriptional regulator AlpA
MGKSSAISKEDAGAALMAWYADAIRQYPEGLVIQAQAAHMLGLSRMSVARLVNRGYIRAVYFPKPPDLAGVTVGYDDPTWLKLLHWFDRVLDKGDEFVFPQACYVSFCEVDWELAMARRKKDHEKEMQLAEKHRKEAEAFRGSR